MGDESDDGILASLGKQIKTAASQSAAAGGRAVTTLSTAVSPPAADPSAPPAPPVNPIRRIQQVVGGILGLINAPKDMLDVGFANLTSAIAAVFPEFPAATITMLYVGIPHAHSHPPSLIPPAPPVPLPSIGAITLGTSIKVLLGGMPAARCGDIGLAPTCGGLFPFFQIKTGSSNVFIGGNRAARMLDICTVCSQAEERKSVDAGKIMSAIGAAASAAQTAIHVGGLVAGGVGIIADTVEAFTEPEPAMEAAKALAAAMAAAQMAADLAAKAITKTMGKDPGIPPSSVGAITLGQPTVLIGGFPMVNIPNPVDLLLGKLSQFKAKPPADEPEVEAGSKPCPP